MNKGAVPNKLVVILTDIKTIVIEETRKALPVVNLIEEKRNDVIKGRACVDGSR